MATISVAVTTCNGERFLGEQLRSIAAQVRLPDELVVADDQSTDQT
jgi:glycosyltransferase involved in cell wall biosynthesis